MDNAELKRMSERYMEQMTRLAVETGKALDKAMETMEAHCKQMYEEASREAKPHTEEMKRLAKDIIGDVKNDMPRVRAEIREMECRARQKLKEMREQP